MTKIEPALTAEEWKESLDYLSCNPHAARFVVAGWEGETWYEAPEDRHASAALALYGQPFGFTREDVRRLRGELHPDGRPAVLDLADRIEALLPKE